MNLRAERAHELDALEAERNSLARRRSKLLRHTLWAWPVAGLCALVLSACGGKSVFTLSYVIALLGLPIAIATFVQAVRIVRKEGRIDRELDQRFAEADLEDLVTVPLATNCVIGDHVFARTAPEALEAAHTKGRLGILLPQFGMLAFALGMAAAAPWLIVTTGWPSLSQPWHISDYKMALTVLGAPFFVYFGLRLSLERRSFGWSLIDGVFTLHRTRLVFGTCIQSVGAADLGGFERTGGAVDVILAAGESVRILEPGSLHLGKRTGTLGLPANRVARHETLAYWQARRVVNQLREMVRAAAAGSGPSTDIGPARGVAANGSAQSSAAGN